MRSARALQDGPRRRNHGHRPGAGARRHRGRGAALAPFLFLAGLLGFASDRSLIPATPPREQEEIPSEGLVWHFDEGGGFSVGEALGRVPTGWLCGARRVAGPPGYGSAVHFDGIDDFLLLPHSPHLSPRRALTLASGYT